MSLKIVVARSAVKGFVFEINVKYKHCVGPFILL